jgi:hypothetical protein
MIDASIFEDLSRIKGYIGAVLSDYTGEVLVSDATKLNKLDETSMRFNEDFRNLHEVTKRLGQGHTKNINLSPGRANIIMICGGTDHRHHLHAFVILDENGSAPLAKIALESVLHKAIESLG